MDEAGTADAGSAESGAADAGPFCASLSPAPSFCADFDESTDPTAGWSGVNSGQAGANAVDSSVVVSGSHSLSTLLPAGTANSDSHKTIGKLLEKYTQLSGNHITLDVELRMESAIGGPGSGAQVATVYFGENGAIPYSVHLKAATGGLALQQDIQPTNGDPARYPATVLTSKLALNAWTHVKLDLDFTARTITVTIGSDPAFVHAMDTGAVNGPVTVDIGAIYFGATQVPATSFHHDNVVLRVE